MPTRGTREDQKRGVEEWIDPTNSSRMGERKRRHEPESKSVRDNDGRADGRMNGQMDGRTSSNDRTGWKAKKF